MTDQSVSEESVFEELLDASVALETLPDLARVEAWASSALGIWAEDPLAAAIDAEFVAWLEASSDPRADALLSAVERLLRPTVGAVSPTRAWSVVIDGVTSMGVGFVAEDQSEYSLLADLVDGELRSLVVAPGPDELFALLQHGDEDDVAPDPVEIVDACVAMRDGWQAFALSQAEPPEHLFVNLAVARARLGEALAIDMSAFGRVRATSTDVSTALDATLIDEAAEAAERAELDKWACSVLDGAGVGPGTPNPGSLIDPLNPDRWSSYPAAEAEAFAALEWADWLGVAIELTRLEAGSVIEPSRMVDMVNRCPEVTSSIPRRDRPYYEWAFSMVLPIWIGSGVLDASGELSPDGAALVVGALRNRWSESQGPQPD